MRHPHDQFERHSRRVMRIGCLGIAAYVIVALGFIGGAAWVAVTLIRHLS